MSEAMNISSSPHVRDKWTTPYIMRVVLMSLMPATCVGIIAYGWQALAIIVLAVVSAVATELLFNLICHKPVTVWDGSAAVTGLLLGLSLGPRTPLYLPVIGSVFAIAVVKGCFGGLGKNFINPALAGRCFLLLSFAGQMSIGTVLDASTSATPMMALRQYETVDISRMFLGTADGVIGSSILALLIGGLVLWSMDIIHGQICFSVLGGFSLFIVLFGGHGLDLRFLLAHICGGGVVMGAFYMATDYVTSPVSRLGQFVYGALIGVMGGVFRLYGGTADSFSYSVIIANLLTPLIDTYVVHKPLAYRWPYLYKWKKSDVPLLQRIPRPVIVLTAITLIAGLALSGVYTLTKENIDEQKRAARQASFLVVCPGATHFENVAEQAVADLAGQTYGSGFGRVRINEALAGLDDAESAVGHVISVTSADGFDGDVSLAVGIGADGAVNGISFTELNETPGMGMRVDEPEFKDQFSGRQVERFELNKAGGSTEDEQIDTVSGSSTTSGAVVNAVNAALDFYRNVVKGGA